MKLERRILSRSSTDVSDPMVSRWSGSLCPRAQSIVLEQGRLSAGCAGGLMPLGGSPQDGGTFLVPHPFQSSGSI